MQHDRVPHVQILIDTHLHFLALSISLLWFFLPNFGSYCQRVVEKYNTYSSKGRLRVSACCAMFPANPHPQRTLLDNWSHFENKNLIL